MLEHDLSNAPSPTPTPTPTPSPTVKDKCPNGHSSTQNDLRRPDSEQEPPDPPPPIPKCPHKKIIAIYHETLPELSQIQVWDKSSKGNLSARWHEDPVRQNLDFWKAYFAWVKKSDFLMGKVKDFRADLHWLVRPTNMAKTINGRYHRNSPDFHNKLQEIGKQWLEKMKNKDTSDSSPSL